LPRLSHFRSAAAALARVVSAYSGTDFGTRYNVVGTVGPNVEPPLVHPLFAVGVPGEPTAAQFVPVQVFHRIKSLVGK
jgi:hypothetical protein